MKEFICMLKTLLVMAILVKFYSQKQPSTGVLIIAALKIFQNSKKNTSNGVLILRPATLLKIQLHCWDVF